MYRQLEGEAHIALHYGSSIEAYFKFCNAIYK